MFRYFVCVVAAAIAVSGQVLAQTPVATRLATWEWKVDDATRKALVHLPAKPEGAPVVLVWHGHGGRMEYIAAALHVEKLWPEAVVVYPQGLPTTGRVSDPEGKQAGWQFDLGQYGDRDLKFFDAILATLTTDQHVDAHRIFSAGHSNGARFSYLLWALRPEKVAAIAAIGTQPVERFEHLPPKPCLHVAGRNDAVAKFDGQRAGLDRIRKDNACEAVGRPWSLGGLGVYFPSRANAPLVEYIHKGGHEIPPKTPEMLVEFFKEVSASR
ncbi:alpha/beta hydrolase family esterase [Paludisphaera rhizosphaerae]|uniref:alpha/beta hydrolase family esterase n=1 Tax=Paludisphaera rhizosphaerae TaxID=2711216 RepID=UPI0013EE3555|nr:esterase [Paludisphaera rhizosphaerae]